MQSELGVADLDCGSRTKLGAVRRSSKAASRDRMELRGVGNNRQQSSRARAQVVANLKGVGSRARCGSLLEPALAIAPVKHMGSPYLGMGERELLGSALHYEKQRKYTTYVN
jgi:hypothetical protein